MCFLLLHLFDLSNTLSKTVLRRTYIRPVHHLNFLDLSSVFKLKSTSAQIVLLVINVFKEKLTSLPILIMKCRSYSSYLLEFIFLIFKIYQFKHVLLFFYLLKIVLWWFIIVSFQIFFSVILVRFFKTHNTLVIVFWRVRKFNSDCFTIFLKRNISHIGAQGSLTIF